MMHISTSTKLKEKFMSKYSKDFKITGGRLMKSFLGMQVEQGNKKIKLHLDHYDMIMSKKCSQSTRTTSRSRFVPSVFR